MDSPPLVPRLLVKPTDSFFLFGPRGVGKTTWIKSHFARAVTIDLLQSRQFLDLSRDPSLLEAKIGDLPVNSWVVIDEIQKIPSLLDEVHWLMEERKIKFALTGSSARKLRRSGVNLLGGRAITRYLFPLTAAEWSRGVEPFDLHRALQWGGLPKAVFSEDPVDFLEAYYHTYLKEEIREEGLVRRIEPFVRFLEIAGNYNGQVLNVERVASECGSKRVTVDKWFEILEDTLIGHRLPAWRPGFKTRESAHPKFYWCDPGIVRAASARLYDPLDSSLLGLNLETWIYHELRAYNHYQRKGRSISYYALPSDLDVDFVIETKKASPGSKPEIVGIEVKLSKKWRREWEGPLRDLAQNPRVKVAGMYGVYGGEETLSFGAFKVLPIPVFLKRLQEGKVF